MYEVSEDFLIRTMDRLEAYSITSYVDPDGKWYQRERARCGCEIVSENGVKVVHHEGCLVVEIKQILNSAV